MSQPDPNFPDTPPESSQDQSSVPNHAETAPDQPPAASQERETPQDDPVFEQADIAEPFEADITQDGPSADEPFRVPESRISYEVFQQSDIAEPFEAAIPDAILEGTHTPEPEASAPDAPAEMPLLFDMDYAPHPSASMNIVSQEPEPPGETVFGTEEFGASTPLNTPERNDAPPQRSFDDLTLSEMVGLFLRQPRATWGALMQVLTDSSETSAKKKDARVLDLGAPTLEDARFDVSYDVLSPSQRRRWWGAILQNDAVPWDGLTLVLHVMAYLSALAGCWQFVSTAVSRRSEDVQLAGGFPALVTAALIWLAAEMIQHRVGIRAWFTSRRPLNWLLMALRLIPITLFIWVLMHWMDASDESNQSPRVLDMVAPTFPVLLAAVLLWFGIDGLTWVLRRRSAAPPPFTALGATDEPPTLSVNEYSAEAERAPIALSASSMRETRWLAGFDISDVNLFKLASAICGTVLMIVTYMGSAKNRMADPIFYAWIASAVLWAIALSPHSWQPRRWLSQWQTRIRTLPRPGLWLILVVVGIGLLAVSMRTDRLYGDPIQDTRIPPEMTSDHVEKILDAQRVLEGPNGAGCFGVTTCNRDIFFANNGGREPFQMYALAFIANATGRDVDYNLLKSLALFESLLTLPIIGWLAWEILATEKRRLRLIFVLVAVALVAVSYWHLNITRLSLRIVLTPAITSLLLIYLARAMRHNHRADFIKAGICLGVGLYMYQAVRMLPVVIVVGIVMAAYFGTRHWRERGRYVLNLAALVLMSVVIFVPMLRYTVENPDMFLRRTAGRLFGDEIISTTLADGTIIERKATLEEQLTAFQTNIPVLLSNMRNALLMFHWKGDVAWINNAPNWPALDPYVGALLVLGVMAWGSLAVRRGDVVYAFIPIVIVIMLLPSALSIAYPIENPSFTRTSGALPAVFLLAAYPLALAFHQIERLFQKHLAAIGVGFIGFSLLMLAYSHSMSLYSTRFVESYLSSSLPYSQAGQILRGFATSDGSFGNAFMIAYTYWWDHRAIGLEAGLTDWPNGIVTREDVPRFLQAGIARADATYLLNPEQDLIFFYSPFDVETSAALKEWFPGGRETRITAYQEGDDFMIYRVPTLGYEGFAAFVAQNTSP